MKIEHVTRDAFGQLSKIELSFNTDELVSIVALLGAHKSDDIVDTREIYDKLSDLIGSDPWLWNDYERKYNAVKEQQIARVR